VQVVFHLLASISAHQEYRRGMDIMWMSAQDEGPSALMYA